LFPVLLFAACGAKKRPESLSQPETGELSRVSAPAVSGAAAGNKLLLAPGRYLKAMAGHAGEAKAARALYERIAKEESSGLDLNNTGGN
jgi:hypothetical protein